MPLEFVKSSRGHPLLCVDSYTFRKDREHRGRTTWRCNVKTCKARIATQNDTYESVPEHTHAPDPLDIRVRVHLNRLREAAVNDAVSRPATVIAQTVQSINSDAVRGRMPNVGLLRQTVRNARVRTGTVAPVNAVRREDLRIPDSLKMTSRSEAFLLYDSGEGDINRLVVFATASNLTLLKDCDEWFVDGTFKVCPSIFQQLYTFHVKLPEGTTVPVVFSLLPAKSSATYRRLLDVIVNVLDGFHPQVVHIDFEVAMIKELELAFPAAGILGCFFHFSQCIWRNIQSDAAFRDMYLRDPEFAIGVRMFPALAFVPVGDVRTVFEELLESNFVRDNPTDFMTRFINYFEATWVGRERNPAIMKREWWNVHAATLDNINRTNNNVEGWHSAFVGRLGCPHPTFSRLVEQLQLEQGKIDFIVSNTTAQGSGAPSKRVYRNRQQRLHDLVATYAQRSNLQFLRAIAHNICF